MAKRSAGPVGGNPPTHLIVFRERSNKNVSVLSSALKVGMARATRGRSACAVLKEKHGVSPKVFERMGVAAASLSEDDIKGLKGNDAVEEIVKNEIRTIPPDIIASDEGEDESPVSDMDPMTAYLQGIRDAADLALRFRARESGEAEESVDESEGMGSGPSIASLKLAWHLRLIGVSKYPDLTGDGIGLAVLDTGINLNHPDFQGRVVDGQSAVSFVPGESVQDGNGHGTHCAGLAAGPQDPQRGRRYGVAFDASLLVGKVLNDQGSGYDSQILDGMDWAAENGAKIISMSLGSKRGANVAASVAYERLASALMQQGILIVGAAGNSSRRPGYISPVENPAACRSILAVAAVDRRKRVASFSCGKVDSIGEVDVSAPGVNVRSAWMGRGYKTISGTSMATPLVAGIAALLAQKNPGATAQDLWNTLQNTAQSIGGVNDFGAGLVRAPR